MMKSTYACSSDAFKTPTSCDKRHSFLQSSRQNRSMTAVAELGFAMLEAGLCMGTNGRDGGGDDACGCDGGDGFGKLQVAVRLK